MTVKAKSSFLQEMADDLHDLCQPLTALQFYLESAKLSGHCDALKLAVDDSLEQTRRVALVIAQMRRHLLHQSSIVVTTAGHRS